MSLPANDTRFFASAEELCREIPDGALLALPPDHSVPAMEAVRGLVRKKSRRLRLLGVPVLGMCADLLIGAGCVAEVESSAVSLGEAGLAPRFTEAAEKNAIKVIDGTCPAVLTALQAAEKGVPFVPLRGVLGSDLVAARPDWMTIQNPFSKEADPILLVPALSPDIALFHVRWADRAGNVWIGKRKELGIIAHAAKKTFVTCEALHDGNLLEDELLAAGTLPGVYVSGVAPAPRGAWPLAVPGLYPADDAHLAQYARAAASRQGFERYLDEHVWNRAKSSSPVSSPA